MPDDVKGVRAAESGRRDQARTRFARTAVVKASRTLFLERGYATATIEAISTLADVPQPTIYRLFGSKLGILKALLDVSIAGDDEPHSIPERPHVARVFAEADPVELLAGFAAITTAINQRTNDVYRVLVGAAGADPEAADLLREIDQQRASGQGEIVRALSRRHSLRADLAERDAADLIHALMSPDVYRLLVVDRRWPPKKYERWLETTLAQQLI